jgi:hypothetical protein
LAPNSRPSIPATIHQSSRKDPQTPHPRATDARSRGIKFPISNVLEVLVEAAYSHRKADLLARANRDIEVLRWLIRMAMDRKLLTPRQYEHCCFTLAALVGRKTNNKDVNHHMRDFISAIKNKEYEDYENLPSSALKIASLLDANNASLLLDLLVLFFDTGYSNGGAADFIEDRGMSVLLCS